MNKRLQQFINAENISQSQFADSIGVARASVSHIISGRNKPGFDFVEKMARAFPALNIEWLITGRGRMYKPTSGDAPQAIINESDRVTDDLFGHSWEESLAPVKTIDEVPVPAIEPTVISNRSTETKTKSNTSSDTEQNIVHQRSITKIIVFYDDNSFQELR